MRKMLLMTLLVSCVAAAPAYAHDWYPLGWSGPYPTGGTDKYHPENLCKNFTSFACVVAGTQSFGAALKKWQVNVWNSGGLNTTYYTNDRDTPGWIVLVGATGLRWAFTPMPGSYNGVVCDSFSPGAAGDLASQSWGGSNYFYQAVFNGTFQLGPCVAP